MRRTSTYSLFLAAAVLALPGCDDGLPHGDLGRVIYRLPDVPGTDLPYELPELEGMKSVDEAAVWIPGPAWPQNWAAVEPDRRKKTQIPTNRNLATRRTSV